MIALESAGPAMADSAVGKLRARGRPEKWRPVPADFAQMAPGKTDNWLRKHYHCGAGVVARWRVLLGLPEVHRPRPEGRRPAEVRAAPADFRIMAPQLHKLALCRHYGVGLKVMNRWLDDAGVHAAEPPLAGHALGLPVPENFAEVAGTMPRGMLARHYDRSDKTIDRWVRLSGATPPVRKPIILHRQAPAAPATDGTLASAAAQYLRRRFVVYRCDVRPLKEREHLPNKGVGLWFVAGKGELPPEQLVDLARDKGFDPRAWAQL